MSEQVIRHRIASLPAGATGTLRELLGPSIWRELCPTRDAKLIKRWNLLQVIGKTNSNALLYTKKTEREENKQDQNRTEN